MRPDVVYQVIFLKDGKPLASPTVLGEYGRDVRVEVPGEMRVVVCAQEPDEEGRSFTSAKMALYEDGEWLSVKEMSMNAFLSMTPSFEHCVASTPFRFIVRPRSIVPAASEADS